MRLAKNNPCPLCGEFFRDSEVKDIKYVTYCLECSKRVKVIEEEIIKPVTGALEKGTKVRIKSGDWERPHDTPSCNEEMKAMKGQFHTVDHCFLDYTGEHFFYLTDGGWTWPARWLEVYEKIEKVIIE